MEISLLARLEPVPVPTSFCQSFDPEETLQDSKLKPTIAGLVVDVFHIHDIPSSHQLSQTTLGSTYIPHVHSHFPLTSPRPHHALQTVFCFALNQTCSAFTRPRELLKFQTFSRLPPTSTGRETEFSPASEFQGEAHTFNRATRDKDNDAWSLTPSLKLKAFLNIIYGVFILLFWVKRREKLFFSYGRQHKQGRHQGACLRPLSVVWEEAGQGENPPTLRDDALCGPGPQRLGLRSISIVTALYDHAFF